MLARTNDPQSAWELTSVVYKIFGFSEGTIQILHPSAPSWTPPGRALEFLLTPSSLVGVAPLVYETGTTESLLGLP